VLESEGRLHPIDIRYSAAPTSRSAPASRATSKSSSLAHRVAERLGVTRESLRALMLRNNPHLRG